MAAPQSPDISVPERKSFIGRHPRVVLFLIVIFSIALVLAGVEISLRVFLGLGDPLLYQSSPLFGYRLQANQLVHRIGGAEIRVNNLGLRAESDWDYNRENKILFLGNSVTFGGTYVSNKDLFSYLAVQGLDGYISGNAGVNGWGVENIHALVVDYGFLPASVYVTVLQEMDFDRGLSKFAGQPFWSNKPHLALEELFFFFCFNQLVRVHVGHDQFVTPLEREKAIERSVVSLKALDEFLKSKGLTHLIYMSTDKPQLLEGKHPDPLIMSLLKKYNLTVSFIRDRAELKGLAPEQVNNLFYDWNHLDKPGHELWGKIIGHDLQLIIQERGSGAANEKHIPH